MEKAVSLYHKHISCRAGNVALKKQVGGVVGRLQEEKTRGDDKKPKAPCRPGPEIKREGSRESKNGEEEKVIKGKKEVDKGEEVRENREVGSREGCQQVKGVAVENPELTTEVNKRVERGGKVVEVVRANGEVELPDGVQDVDAYCDNREPHVSLSQAFTI